MFNFFLELCVLLNEHRVQYGMLPLQFSAALFYVAEVHRLDLLATGKPSAPCDLHSWQYNLPYYDGCCYNNTPGVFDCMFEKPSELSAFKAFGFEIAAYGCSSAQCVANAWFNSHAHNDVILSNKMRSVGCSLTTARDYSLAWFALEEDGAWGNFSGDCYYRSMPPIPHNNREPQLPVCSTEMPVMSPTVKPTVNPTVKPVVNPTNYPSANPTIKPTDSPTAKPTVNPTMNPTMNPTVPTNSSVYLQMYFLIYLIFIIALFCFT